MKHLPSILLLPALLLTSCYAAADSNDELMARLEALEKRLNEQQQTPSPAPSSPLSWEGYAVVNLYGIDTYSNAQDNEPEFQWRADVERFVLEPNYHFNDAIRFVAEIEFEHGGTGSAVEYEAEEFGEYEGEIEQGGEVLLEELFIEISQSRALNWRFGHMAVHVGMVNTHSSPSDYFSTRRSPAETSLIPSSWHATGASVYGWTGPLRYELQLVNGLDSTGFSGATWVAGGQRQKQEFATAQSMAVVARADWQLADDWLIGGSVYSSDSGVNRSIGSYKEPAQVTIAEVHTRFASGPWTARAQYLQGMLDNAAGVTRANQQTYNGGELGVSRTQIGAEAWGAFVEAGYNLLAGGEAGADRRLDLFARLDRFDSMSAVDAGQNDILRYDRQIITGGVNFQLHPGVVFKGEVAQETNQSNVANESLYAALGVGVEF